MKNPANIIRSCEQLPTAFTLVNLTQVDQPLVYVNAKFCQLTGYEREEILGRNCRFLQGEKTDNADVEYIRNAIEHHYAGLERLFPADSLGF